MIKNIADYLTAKTAKELGLNDIARAVGVSDSFLSRLRSGQIKEPGLEFAINLALYFNEPPDSILRLIGKESYYPKLRRLMAREFNTEPVIQINVPSGEFEGIKCLDTPAVLGPGRNMDEAQLKGYFPIHKSELPKGYRSDPDRIVCFPTEGTSMVPTIMPGSHIMIDRYVPSEWVTPGGVYAFLLPSGDVTIKRLVKHMDGCLLIDADNTDQRERAEGSARDFPRLVPLREDVSVIRGRVIWVLNRFIEEPKE